MDNDLKSLMEDIVPKIGEYFKNEYPEIFQSRQTFFKTELNILRFLHELGKQLMQYLVVTLLETGYEGSTTNRRGRTFRFNNNVTKNVHCLFGVITYKRAQYTALDNGKGLAPVDEKLGLEKKHTPACAYMLNLLIASMSSYNEATALFQDFFRSSEAQRISLRKAEDMSYELGFEVEKAQRASMKHIENRRHDKINTRNEISGTMVVSIDATKLRHKDGELMLERDEKGRNVYKEGYKDVKLASISALSVDKNGEGRCDNTSFVGAIEHADRFFLRVEAEVIRRNAVACRRKVFICDGAKWIWKRLEQLVQKMDEAIFILDYYHALEHLAYAVEAIEGRGSSEFCIRFRELESLVYDGNIKRVISILEKEMDSVSKNNAKIIRAQIKYFVSNISYMHYDRYRAMNLPIGSGTIESACKNVIGTRMKRGGMTWSETGASAMIHTRCSITSGTFYEDYTQILAQKDEILAMAA